MKNPPTKKFGSVLHLKVLRADGRIDDYGYHPNSMGQVVFSTGKVITTVQNATFYTRSIAGIVDLDGTYSQTGTTITRVTGSTAMNVAITNDDIVRFSSGEWSYITARSTTTATASKSQTVSTTTAKVIKAGTTGYGRNANSTSGLEQQTSGVPMDLPTYSNGLYTRQISNVVFDPATTGYTLRCIAVNLSMTSYNGGSPSAFFDLSSPITINVGDAILVSSFVLTFTLDEYLPRTFAVSPLVGLTGTGKIQRLRKIVDTEILANRIFLITDANKITLPNALWSTDAYINPSSLTIAETLTASSLGSSAAGSANSATDSMSCYGTTVVGGTFKQIAWGTTSQLYGIIEYDTPVVIAASKVITISTSLQYLEDPSNFS